MFKNVIKAVVVAVVVTLACILLGAILITLKVEVAVVVGQWFVSYAPILGVLAGLWQFATGRFA